MEKITCRKIVFANGKTQLSGVLILPSQFPAPYPLVVFIHGSGPAARDGYNHYPPLWDEFAKIGFASLSWDKPGIGESSGDWETQDWMGEERTEEVNAAINKVLQRKDLDPNFVGLWGISQAGWIFPKLLRTRRDIAFIIAVSVPGGTVCEQMNFFNGNLLREKGWPESLVSIQLEFERLFVREITSGSSYEKIIEQMKSQEENLSQLKAFLEQRNDTLRLPSKMDFETVKVIVGKDFPPKLESIYCPTLAIFGGRDAKVDVSESMQVYRTAFANSRNPNLEVKLFKNADHDMCADGVIPRDYLQCMSDWLQERKPDSRPPHLAV